LAKAKLTKVNLDNIMVMKCKVMACEIVDIIMDMETNVRISKATQTLKSILSEETTKGNISPNHQSSVMKNMASAFRRGADKGRDDKVYDVDMWIEEIRKLLKERDIFEYV
jgi:hypothetical protein